MDSGVLVMRNWKSLAVRGVVAVLFGLALFIWPGISIGVLITLFGIFAFVDGIIAILVALRSHGKQALVLEGVIGILIGLFVFLWPGVTAMLLVILIAVWAILTGIMEIAFAFSFGDMVTGKWLMILSGVLSVIIGVFLASRPGAGIVLITWLIGAYAILFGMMLFGIAMHIHGLQKK